MVEETLKRYADDITVRELVRLRTENELLQEAVKSLFVALVKADANAAHAFADAILYPKDVK